MHEHEEPIPATPKEFTTGRALMESWEICSNHFIALTAPMLLLLLIVALLSAIAEKLTSVPIGGTLFALGMVISTMSIHRTVMNLKLRGTQPTFRSAIQAGTSLFGRGLASSLLTLTATILIYFVGVLLISPGIMLWVQNKSPAAGLLLWTGIFGAFLVYQWFLTRICLVPSAVADRQLGLFEALKYSWILSGSNFKAVRRVWLSLLAFIVITSMVFAGTYWSLVGFDLCSESSAFMLLLLPIFITSSFAVSLINTALCLTYLSVKATSWSPAAPPLPG